MNGLYPLVFEKNIHTAIWGSEDWLVSAHPSSPCIIANGAYQGVSLSDLVADKGVGLLGRKLAGCKEFPLLLKIIEAHDRLSVQVHPNETTAPLTGGEPKTEMWYVVGHEKDGAIFAGLKNGTRAEDVDEAVRTQRFEELCVKHDVEDGQVYFIPGGLVHAICGGVKIFEVQQSSNTTYRLYDWGRVGKDGKPRQLHIDESLKSIDYALPVPVPQSAVKCEFFDFSTRRVEGTLELSGDGEFFKVVHVLEGEVEIESDGMSFELKAGMCTLVPAVVSVTVKSSGATIALVTP